MPTIACPGCGKKYNVPVTAAGQVAKCACGKQFRLSAGKTPVVAASLAPAVAAAASATASHSGSVAPKPRPAALAPKKTAEDDFWDDALREEQTARVIPPAPRPEPVEAAKPSKPAPDKKAASKKAKKKKSGGIKWGADWGKVVGGLTTFFVAGGITVGLVITTDRIFFWPAGIAIVGLFTALSGLMGEDGIW